MQLAKLLLSSTLGGRGQKKSIVGPPARCLTKYFPWLGPSSIRSIVNGDRLYTSETKKKSVFPSLRSSRNSMRDLRVLYLGRSYWPPTTKVIPSSKAFWTSLTSSSGARKKSTCGISFLLERMSFALHSQALIFSLSHPIAFPVGVTLRFKH